MDTKNTLQKLILDAQLHSDECVRELFSLMHQAVVDSTDEDIHWYTINAISENDVLLYIVLNDIDLSVNFDNVVLVQAVCNVFRFANSSMISQQDY